MRRRAPAWRAAALAIVAWASVGAADPARPAGAFTYRRIDVEETAARVTALHAVPERAPPRWAADVSQESGAWPALDAPERPRFEGPIPFVIAPTEAGEPFYAHNHDPSVTWLPNGDLLAVWYSTPRETDPRLTILASRLRRGSRQWDPSSEFLKAADHNMHAPSVYLDKQGTLFHFNAMAPRGAASYARLCLLVRTSRDNGATWTPPRAVAPEFGARHQVISGTFETRGGLLVQPCDAVSAAEGGTALWLSPDAGVSWHDPGAGRVAPAFRVDQKGDGTIAGIHAGVVERADGTLMALGRGNAIGGFMPLSLSADQGDTWTYRASPFPPIGAGQRLVLRRLREGALLLVSFTSDVIGHPTAHGMHLTVRDGREAEGFGMFAALSFDDGATWPVRRLVAPPDGEYDGGAWTGRFRASATQAEPGGYLAATQSPDGMIHLISSRLYYRLNVAWLTEFYRGPVHWRAAAGAPRTFQ